MSAAEEGARRVRIELPDAVTLELGVAEARRLHEECTRRAEVGVLLLGRDAGDEHASIVVGKQTRFAVLRQLEEQLAPPSRTLRLRR